MRVLDFYSSNGVQLHRYRSVGGCDISHGIFITIVSFKHYQVYLQVIWVDLGMDRGCLEGGCEMGRGDGSGVLDCLQYMEWKYPESNVKTEISQNPIMISTSICCKNYSKGAENTAVCIMYPDWIATFGSKILCKWSQCQDFLFL